MTINSRFKSILVIVTTFIFSACSNSNLPVENQNTKMETNGSVIQITPTPLLGQKAKVQGEYQPIKIADNLKNSIEQQGLPNVWLEFNQGNDKILKTKLSDKIKENLNSAGQALFRYQYVINNSENPDERFNASYNQTIIFVNSLNEIRELEINSPEGKRKLTEDEIDELFGKQSGLINDRYFELDDHFKPKSAFYNLKKSVNEKLGHQIF